MADRALLRDGASAGEAATLRQQQLDAALWLEDFLAAGYGPRGAAKLVVAADGAATWVRSPALALREAGSGPLLAAYVELAARTHQACGDGATAAVLLAARLVSAALQDERPPVPAWLDGYRLARRQALAWLAATAAPAPTEAALAYVAPSGWGAVALGGLEKLGKRGEAVDLGIVDVRAEPDGPAWLDGVVAEPQQAPRVRAASASTGVLLLSAGWSVKPRAEGAQATVRSPAVLGRFADAEAAVRRKALDRLRSLGVGFVACAKSLDDDLRGLLADAGITVWTDAPLGALLRLEQATGAKRVARVEDASASDVGTARLTERTGRGQRGWLATGKGPSATFVVPAHSKPAADAAVEAGEGLLRTAGALLAAPPAPGRAAAVPGGGRWQRGLAVSLRQAADAAPGKAPIAIRAAADAIDALADDLLRNAGQDPLAGGVLADADAVLDPLLVVRRAVDGAFATATALLRLDGAYAKRSSSAAGLRGGTGKVGSPKGMPGDLPPLM